MLICITYAYYTIRVPTMMPHLFIWFLSSSVWHRTGHGQTFGRLCLAQAPV